MANKRIGGGAVTISTTISKELHERCSLNKIGWSEALRQGATLMLSRIDDNYKNRVQLERQLEKQGTLLQSIVDEKNRLSDDLEKLKKKKH